ncbi:MAG: hypothetical protein JNM93_00865 [Bacteriovoracaceae bacterium]|nr:hypothetical protein [Bacteriovoracaceae bacterium]
MKFIVFAGFFLASVFDLYACQGGQEFTIQKGSHKSKPRKFAFVSGKTFKFSACFDSSAKYNLGNVNQFDTNKLFGHSDCTALHTKHSARFGWLWNTEKQKIDIMAFVHANSQFSYEYMGEMGINEKADFKIQTLDNHYQFEFKGKSLKMARGCSQKNPIRYKLYPYFGGNETAPHKIQINIWD